ncbi:MAG TPA: lysozyme [Acetobacteraceae bacterium]|nr:lysozyme [Acetobacteraceae bacterium]
MTALEIAARLLRQLEGCVLTPYQDQGGTWTIGIGTTHIDGQPVTGETPPIATEQAEAYMQAELQPTAAEVDREAPPDATDAQRAACYSFAYNEGVGAFAGSTLLRLWRSGDVEGAAAQFDAWVYAGGHVSKGLVNRRALEKAVFLGQVRV